MKVLRDEFPGIELIMDNLPDLGKLFVQFFSENTRVKLKPWLPFRGMPPDVLELYVERFAGTATIFSGDKKALQFVISQSSLDLEDFKLREDHLGLNYPEITGKFKTWLENRISALLNFGEVHLELSSDTKYYLTASRYTALPCFISANWHPDRSSLQKIKFHLAFRKPACLGLVIPKSDNYLYANWDKILPPESDYHKLMLLIVKWYYSWYAAMGLAKNEDDSIDFPKMWKRYQDELRVYEQYFKDV